MLQRFKYLLLIYFSSIVLMSLQKFIFLLAYLDTAKNFGLGEWAKIFTNGITLDISVAGYITAVPLLMLILSVWIPLSDKNWRRVFLSYFTFIAALASLIMAVDLALYEYWGFRLDSSVLFYLKSPKSAMASVTLRDAALGVGVFTVGFVAMFATYKWCANRLQTPRLKIWQSTLSAVVILLCGGVIFIGIRGGVTASVANLSKVYFSNETFLNHAAVNPQFSLLSTIGEEDDFVNKYQFYGDEELVQNIENLQTPTCGETPKLLNTERPNILFIIGESFSDSVIKERVDGQAIMPNLIELSHEGVNFTNAIANSFRTDRGVTAAIYGFPAQPQTSIMKYPSKSHKLPSLAAELQGVGYTTEFIYGGDLNFTDMASMLYSTGWERLKWQQNVGFEFSTNSQWGYNDSTMSEYVAQSVIELHDEENPYLVSWLTLSSHEPFDVPYDKFSDKVLNAFAYSDDAVGQLIGALRGTPAWDDLLIIITGDHAYPYPYGTKYNSLQRHRIPLIWCGGAVEGHAEIETYMSQMDIVATLLAQMGLDHSMFDFSHNAMDSNFRERGYYTFSDGFGVATSRGSIVYDNKVDQVIFSDSDTCGLELMGKTMLQQTMKILSEY
ncbi:MAG: sulfatase-like hydrolase/transferase [Rikenellaceae bacterium]